MNGLRQYQRNFKTMWPLGVLLLLATLCASCRDEDELEDVEKVIPGVVLDIRYATTNNFTGQQLYPVARCFLRREPAESLRQVQEELRGLGLALKIFDGYRP